MEDTNKEMLPPGEVLPLEFAYITPRQFFAGCALMGMLARSDEASPGERAIDAWHLADALLAADKKSPDA